MQARESMDIQILLNKKIQEKLIELITLLEFITKCMEKNLFTKEEIPQGEEYEWTQKQLQHEQLLQIIQHLKSINDFTSHKLNKIWKEICNRLSANDLIRYDYFVKNLLQELTELIQPPSFAQRDLFKTNPMMSYRINESELIQREEEDLRKAIQLSLGMQVETTDTLNQTMENITVSMSQDFQHRLTPEEESAQNSQTCFFNNFNFRQVKFSKLVKGFSFRKKSGNSSTPPAEESRDGVENSSDFMEIQYFKRR